MDGTASPSVITHYLKLGTTRERLEQEKLSRETELLASKKINMDSQTRNEELFQEAIAAIRAYQGIEDDF